MINKISEGLEKATDTSLNQFIHFCESARKKRMDYLWKNKVFGFWSEGQLYQRKKHESSDLEAWFWVGTDVSWVLFESVVYVYALEAKNLDQHYDLGKAYQKNHALTLATANKILEGQFLVLDVLMFEHTDSYGSPDCQTILRILGQDGIVYTAFLAEGSYFPHMLYEKVLNDDHATKR